MSRRSRLIAITALGALSCNTPDATPNTTPTTPDRIIATSNPPSTSPPEPVPSGLTSLAEREAPKSTAPLPETPARDAPMGAVINPVDDQGRQIRLSYSGEYCYIELPFPPDAQVPPGSAPPQEQVICPDIMADPAWLVCVGGTLYADPNTDACICHVMGNPPPPPRWAHCPDGSG